MRTLLINPPPVNGIAFTRQGRCQEREEVLGTTKPPYSLLVCAALFRERSLPFRLIDQTAAKLSTPAVIAQLDAEGFRPELIVFPSTTPTLDPDVEAMARLKAHFGAALVSFGPHASTVPAESMARAPAGRRDDRRRARRRDRGAGVGRGVHAGAAGVGAGRDLAAAAARSSRTRPRARSPAS